MIEISFSALHSRPAVRRRQRKKEKDAVGQRVCFPIISDLTRRQGANGGKHQSTASSKSLLMKTGPHKKYSLTDHFPKVNRGSLTDSATVVIHVEDHSVSSTGPVKTLKLNHIAPMNDTEKSKETGIAQRKSTDTDDGTGKNPRIQRSVTVLRVIKSENMDEFNLGRAEQETVDATTVTESKKIGQITVTKVPRSHSSNIKRHRASSVGNINVTHVDRFSIEMQAIASRSKTSMSTKQPTVDTRNGVTVTRLSRNTVAAE